MDPLGAARLTELEAQQAFENGVRGSRAAAYHGVTPYSDGIGLPAARDAARAAHGTVEMYTREDGRGRVHTVFRLRVPAWLDSASPVSVAHPLSECGLSECDGRRGQADEWRGNHRASSSSIAKSSIASRTRTRRACSPGAEAPKQQQQKQQQQKQQQAEAPKQQQTTTTTNPTCILVDDDEVVQLVVSKQIERHGAYGVYALGTTLEEQQHMEDVIMGVRDPTNVDGAPLSPPHVPCAVAVLDLNLALSPPWHARFLGTRADGSSIIPKDGLDLAERLRARGYVGKIILHSAESLATLDELRQHAAIDDVIEKGSALHFKERFGEIVRTTDHGAT